MPKASGNSRRQAPAETPEAREQQMINLAMNLAEKKLRDGTASNSIIVHYLKLGTARAEVEKEKLKAEFGKTMSLLGKSETYLMVGIEDNYDLWMGGKKLDKGAYVALSLLGNASSEDYAKVTAKICNILSSELSIPSDGVYVTYHPIKDWGWNGVNF